VNSSDIWLPIHLISLSLYSFATTHNIISNTNHFYIVHDDSGLYACAKGCHSKDASQIRLEGPQKFEDDLRSMRDDSVLNYKSQMLLMLSLATDEMIRLVAMYPVMWFMDTTAVNLFYFICLFEFM
jgi:hypothetical protein